MDLQLQESLENVGFLLKGLPASVVQEGNRRCWSWCGESQFAEYAAVGLPK